MSVKATNTSVVAQSKVVGFNTYLLMRYVLKNKRAIIETKMFINTSYTYLDHPSLKVSQTGYLILSNYRNDFEGPGMEEHGNLFE